MRRDKEEFPERSGAMTSVYVTAMVGVAGLAGAVSVPLSETGLGWRGALLAYCVIAAMLEFVFIHDGTRGRVLLVLTLSLVVFAAHVPLLIGFTVARYQ